MKSLTSCSSDCDHNLSNMLVYFNVVDALRPAGDKAAVVFRRSPQKLRPLTGFRLGASLLGPFARKSDATFG